MRPVPEGAPPGAHRGGTDPMSTEYQDRRRADLLGRLRGARLGPPARARPGPRRDARGRACSPPSSDPTASCRPSPTRWPPCSRSTGCRPSAGSPRCCCTCPSHDPVPEVERILEGYVASNASTLVLSAISGQDGYDSRPELDEQGWQTLLDNLSRISRRRGRAGHPRRPAPARRHHDREHRRGAAGAGRLVDRALPGHRAPAHRRHRPRRAHPPGTRADRARALQGRRRRPRPSTCRTAAGPTPRASPGACTGRSAPATSTWPRSWRT